MLIPLFFFHFARQTFLFPGFRAIANVGQFQRFVVFSLQCWLFDGSVSVFFIIIIFFKHCKVDHVDSTILFSLCQVDFFISRISRNSKRCSISAICCFFITMLVIRRQRFRFFLICFKHCKVDHVEVTILFHFSRQTFIFGILRFDGQSKVKQPRCTAHQTQMLTSKLPLSSQYEFGG